jgi:transcriptional regulator with PAS, ATPase and Fis domain
LQAEIERRQHTLPSQPSPGTTAALKDQVKQASKRAESEIILRTLEQHRWNRRRTAEALRISYRSLMYKMKNCDIRSDGGMRQSVAQ